jgi:proteic killer suppression protein
VIISFHQKGLRKFWDTGDASALHGSKDRIRRILSLLDGAKAPEEMNLAGLYFHRLSGNPIRYSVRVTANWRITFAWEGPDALQVDFEDYH